MKRKQTESIQEFVSTRNPRSKIDKAAGIIHNVKILGLESRNHRIYPEETLKKAIPLYENARVNLNHPDGNPSEARKYQDRFGMMKNVRFTPGEGLFGDFHFNPKHALAEQLLWDAENNPENVGFSHNVQAILARRDGAEVVEEIRLVRSVDLVADPATTAGLFEEVCPREESRPNYGDGPCEEIRQREKTPLWEEACPRNEVLSRAKDGLSERDFRMTTKDSDLTESPQTDERITPKETSYAEGEGRPRDFSYRSMKTVEGKTESGGVLPTTFPSSRELNENSHPVTAQIAGNFRMDRSELTEHLLTTILSENVTSAFRRGAAWNREFIKMILEIPNLDLAKRFVTERLEMIRTLDRGEKETCGDEPVQAVTGTPEFERNFRADSIEEFVRRIKK